MVGSSGPVDVSEACPVLRAWDLKDDLDSRGAILFRRFASRALGAVPVAGTPGLFTNQFDENDPVHTPNGLNVANPAVEQSFADAVTDLRDAGIPLDAPLRDWQYERRGTERIPIHGGPGSVGVFNAINVGWSGSSSSPGYTNVPHGSSFVMAAQFTDDPDCPVDARTILTYSQSTNPNSPYFGDQTRMFSNKQWKNEAFCEDEIAADPNLEVKTISDAFPRPASAPKAYVSLVPAYEECTEPNVDRTHGPPLVAPSCSQPRQSSQRLTVGNGGAPSRFAGSVRYAARVGAAGLPDDSDISISAVLTDVRCRAGQDTATCGAANAAGGSDYTGELEAVSNLRVTDRLSGTGPEGGVDPATVADFPFPAAIPCSETGTDVGASCAVTTSANALMPGAFKDGRRAVVELGTIRVNDGGQDGQAETAAGNSRFAGQGIFVP
jgi:hypothetical protein